MKAILDWEMCNIGDPLSDVVNFCMIYTKIPQSAKRENPCLSQMFVGELFLYNIIYISAYVWYMSRETSMD